MRLRHQLKLKFGPTRPKSSAPLIPVSSLSVRGHDEGTIRDQVTAAPAQQLRDHPASNPIRRWRWE